MSLLRYESQVRPALVEGEKDYHQVTEDICRPVEAKPSKLWWIGFLISVALLIFGIISLNVPETSICNNEGELKTSTIALLLLSSALLACVTTFATSFATKKIINKWN